MTDPWGKPWVEGGGLVFSSGPDQVWDSQIVIDPLGHAGWSERGDDLLIGHHWEGAFYDEPKVLVFLWGPLSLAALALSLALSLSLARA